MLITVSVVMTLQIWHLGFSHFLSPVDVIVCGKFEYMRMFLNSGVVCTHKLVLHQMFV